MYVLPSCDQRKCYYTSIDKGRNFWNTWKRGIGSQKVNIMSDLILIALILANKTRLQTYRLIDGAKNNCNKLVRASPSSQ